MFRKNRKAQGQPTAQPTTQPTAFQVWYKDSIGRWMHASTHSVRSDANVAARGFTIAQTEVREIY